MVGRRRRGRDQRPAGRAGSGRENGVGGPDGGVLVRTDLSHDGNRHEPGYHDRQATAMPPTEAGHAFTGRLKNRKKKPTMISTRASAK